MKRTLLSKLGILALAIAPVLLLAPIASAQLTRLIQQSLAQSRIELTYVLSAFKFALSRIL